MVRIRIAEAEQHSAISLSIVKNLLKSDFAAPLGNTYEKLKDGFWFAYAI
jgi:hypothetical protein